MLQIVLTQAAHLALPQSKLSPCLRLPWCPCAGLAAGDYTVTILAAETYFTSAGQRVFDVTIQVQAVFVGRS
jgi:hypothetical protein